jgi:hypothetical protein
MASEDHEDLVDRITDTERRLGDAERRLLKLTSERKAAREDVEVLQLELRRLTRELADPKPMPLFDELAPELPAGQPASTVDHGLGCGAISDLAPVVVNGELMGAGSDRALLLAGSDAEAFGFETLAEKGISGISGAEPDCWQLFPVDRVDLPAEVREALKADGVTCCGEWQTGMTDGRLKAFDKLKCTTADEAMEAMDRAVHHLVPHCRVCGWCDEEYFAYGLELGPNFVPGESPPLCSDCHKLSDGPPDPDLIAAEVPTSSYCYPMVLQKRLAKDPAKHLANLETAHADLRSTIDAKCLVYASLAARWPGPESNCFNPGFEGNPRTGYVNGVRTAMDQIAAARGQLVLLDNAISDARLAVDLAATQNAARKAGKKVAAAPAPEVSSAP